MPAQAVAAKLAVHLLFKGVDKASVPMPVPMDIPTMSLVMMELVLVVAPVVGSPSLLMRFQN